LIFQLRLKFSAKAEISATVPEKSAGRFVDAITDLIRPFSEAQGLKADQIRLQREDVLIKIATKARERLAIEDASITPLPNKFMIPFIEAASSEDESDGQVLDAWANLLASAASNKIPPSPRFVSVLKELTGSEASILDQIIRNGVPEGSKTDINSILATALDRDLTFQANDIATLLKRAGRIGDEETLVGMITDTFDFCGVCLMHASFEPVGERDGYFDISGRIYDDEKQLSFDILQSLNLLERYQSDWVEGERWVVFAIAYKVTRFGLELWRACNGAEAADVVIKNKRLDGSWYSDNG
jgi:hypothetical protein